jgi:hypothetical protein
MPVVVGIFTALGAYDDGAQVRQLEFAGGDGPRAAG